MADTAVNAETGFDPFRNERLRALLDHPALWNLSQLVISGGQRATKRWARAWLGARDGDRILDVCCGTGEFAPLFPTRNAESRLSGSYYTGWSRDTRGTRNLGVAGYLGVEPDVIEGE